MKPADGRIILSWYLTKLYFRYEFMIIHNSMEKKFFGQTDSKNVLNLINL